MSPFRVTSSGTALALHWRESRDISPRTAGALEDRIQQLNRERPRFPRHAAARGRSRFNGGWTSTRLIQLTPSTRDAVTVLGGVKGARAVLGGSAALDPACARWAWHLSMA